MRSPRTVFSGRGLVPAVTANKPIDLKAELVDLKQQEQELDRRSEEIF